MKEKVKQIIETVYYTNLEYPVCGNRYILASNLMFNNIGIKDTDAIYELAKVMENNDDLELNDDDFNIIFEKFVQLAKDCQSKIFDDIFNSKKNYLINYQI